MQPETATNISSEPRPPESGQPEPGQRLGYSLRRYYVDEFHQRRVAQLPENARVLDLGGHKLQKRGNFDCRRYSLRITTVDLSTSKQPDIQADATALPFLNQSFDAVICSELLEHVKSPHAVLSEISRVLKPGGELLICVPFLFRVHADPYDYGRYTDYFWRETLTEAGFSRCEIEQQGAFWSVLMDMHRSRAFDRRQQSKPTFWKSRIVWKWQERLLKRFCRWAVQRDHSAITRSDSFLTSYTTGYGIHAVRN